MRCKECGEDFDDRSNKKFCSEKCKNKYWARRHPRTDKCPKCGCSLHGDGE